MVKFLPCSIYTLTTLVYLLSPAVVSAQKTAALIIGGQNSPVLDSVEIFGCPGHPEGSFTLESFPFPVTRAAGTYLESDGSALVCGGFLCVDGRCSTSDRCFSYSPEDAAWTEGGSLTSDKADHIIGEAVNLDSASDDKVPLVIGLDERTNIWDPDASAWREYREAPDNWLSRDCLVQVGDIIYHLHDDVETLDTNTWERVNWGPMPTALSRPGKCAQAEVHEKDGILLRNGYWFDLDAKEFQPLKFPPNTDLVDDEPASMFSYQGRPTIFGSPLCDSAGECEFTEVLSYDSSEDVWHTIGKILESRTYHEVVEVPLDFCPTFIPEQPQPNEDEDVVAMIIGGVSEDATSAKILASVSLFGCPGFEDQTLGLDDYPVPIYMPGVIYHVEEDSVLACGGFTCEDPVELLFCTPISNCYQWTPTNQWEEIEELLQSRWSYILGTAIDIDSDDTETRYPIAVGGTRTQTEILKDGAWQPYQLLSDSNWRTTDCLIQIDDDIFHIKSDIRRLDTNTWAEYVMGELPDFLLNPGSCSMVTISGRTGIMLNNGYYYDLDASTWQSVRFPPYPDLVAEPENSVFVHQGKPTIFGNPVCDNVGENCWYLDVIQYDPDKDMWLTLGQMSETRRYHAVVEVPASFCDHVL